VAYIAFASAKGSPGVTTAVTSLAATWPADRDLVVVEIDPAGGDLVVRFDLATEPGLVTLAAAGRRQLGADTLMAHTQPFPVAAHEGQGSRHVLVAPVSAEQAGASLGALRTGLAGALSALDVDVLVDCGRLDPSSPAYDVAAGADLLVMVARPIVAEVHHLSSRLASLKVSNASLLTVGEKPYSVAEVAHAVGTRALGTLPADARAAAALTEGHAQAVRLLRRSHLMRDARALAESLADWLHPGAAGSPVPEVVAAGGPPPPPPPPPPLTPTGDTQVAAPPGPPPAPSPPDPPRGAAPAMTSVAPSHLPSPPDAPGGGHAVDGRTVDGPGDGAPRHLRRPASGELRR
jgi:MinD-like ATPase involved in chromosome partitioning or flagellar assembly